ncbi:transcription elongation factor GreB [Pseudoroseomonas cervicalis]|uniref:transcription elongation factor GreB n=1 Tax=Teichococcus cervicalis TaxID=204525 RepID=UPI0027859DF5|nr:transcription elongation factor GreB [Pseudoroseomonas cervicalis]MDQ1079627.1 transcription elongation factor GreB [Pseudoroseomonas cervicalis]
MAEDDDEDEGPPGLPPGTPFYMTPAGQAALQEELRSLWNEERPKVVEIVSWAASLGDRSENADYQYGKRRLREIDRRVRFLRKRLERVQVVDPAAQTRRDQVFFGASVTYAREDDSEVSVTIVGVDEADADRGRISWVSPVARALLKARVGDLVRIRTPAGPEEVEVLAITYPE